jgi:DNA polymerase (family 10)
MAARVPSSRATHRHPPNAEIARLLREVAELLELEGSNPFRVRAYENAARVIEELPEQAASLPVAALQELPGVGEDLAAKIAEIGRTGSLGLLRQLHREVPRAALELLRVPGIGPKRARELVETLGVKSIAGLARAARAGKLKSLKGFGAALEKKIIAELAARAGGETRILRATAAQYGEAIREYMLAQPGVKRADLAGSFRRGRETVGDLDLLVEASRGADTTAAFTKYPEVRSVLAQGPTRASVRLASGLQVDLRVLDAGSYGAGLYYFTGSKAHNIAVRTMGQKRGLKINEYGIYKKGDRAIGGRREQDVFDAVGLPWIPPELREDRGEIEAALKGKLPKLVELGDMRGDLQMHSTDSDGRDSLDAMAVAALAMGYEYIAMTDHTPLLRIVNGLDRSRFLGQRKRIDRLNARLGKLTILAGAEVDILEDGSLDLDDGTLESLDVVLVSIHSKFDLPRAKQTARVLRAIEHPAVDIFAHPTGRLIGGRRGAEFDLERVAASAAAHGVMLEVNAQPTRLDLDDVSCRAAIAQGARVTISTDAHSRDELRNMRWGVDQARRGWASKDDVANTRPLRSLLKLLHRGRR